MSQTGETNPPVDGVAGSSSQMRNEAADRPAKSKKARKPPKRKLLRRRIQELERQIAEARAEVRAREDEHAHEREQSESSVPLYGLTPELERAVREALREDKPRQLFRLLRPLHPADYADLIERNSGPNRQDLVTALGRYFDPETLTFLDEQVREEVLPALDAEVLAFVAEELESDDIVELVGDLDDADEQARLLDAIAPAERAMVEESLAFADDSAGRLMQRELVAVPQHWTVGQTIDFLRTEIELPDDFYDIFVTDPARRPLGKLSLSHLLRRKRPVFIADIMETNFHKVPVEMDQEDVALLFRQYGLVSVPVVDDEDRLLGRITVDDVVDVIDEEAEEDLLRLGGVASDDIYGNVIETTRNRFSWLVINLMTAIVASGVIGAFETTIEKVVALAVLMPIVASMGGNSGTQTLTVAVRALAMRELGPTNAARFVIKELTVGSLNGVAFALLAGAASWVWFGDLQIAMIMALAMVINMIVAGLFGTLIPIGLDRFNIDPAVASSVFLTTVTDVVGFFTFLGLAALVLM